MIGVVLYLATYGLTAAVKVHLIVPRLVPSGSSPTLLCQYDLEGESLYAVKWYRGQHEFFRYVPEAVPQMVAFPLGGIQVDVMGSGPEKVRLMNVPKYISGKVVCEVSVEQSFKTTIDTKNLTIVDLDIKKPQLNVSSNVFDPRRNIHITCTVEETDPLPLINFYVDYVKIKRAYITEYGNGTAVLQKEALFDFMKSPPEKYVSPIWLRCDAFLRGVFHRASDSIPIIPIVPRKKSRGSRQTFSWTNILTGLVFEYFILRLNS